jgi:phosphohistidine phosphatase SixA
MRDLSRHTTAIRLLLGTLFICVLLAPLFAISKLVVERIGARAAADKESYVLILRHGDAPGRNEPPNFDLNDCRTQRNLSDKGRNEAIEYGALLRKQGINITKVLTSRWCRTRETAELLKIGAVKNEPAFDNLEFNRRHSADLLDSERKLIASWRGPGVLLVVTHSSNIKALSGLEIQEGAMIMASPTPAGGVTFRSSKISLRDIYS